MPTGIEANLTKETTHCAVCGATDLESIVELPKLPLTGRFMAEQPTSIPAGIDQELLWCTRCGHGQLHYHIEPDVLYDAAYSFRTSESARARVGTSFFLDVLNEFGGQEHFECAVDVGCNDVLFLQELGQQASTRIGIDPIWAGRENEIEDGIEVIGATVEATDLAVRLERPPDLIALRHTIEHIVDPLEMIRTLSDAAAEDAIFLIETPGFEALLRRNRFDQVFHQHAHYFTIDSLRSLMESVGLEYLGHRQNYHDFGAFAAVFRKNSNAEKRQSPQAPAWSADDLRQRYRMFKRQMHNTAEVLQTLNDQTMFGYGAGNLLPVMAYHLETDLNFLEAVLDDDPDKDGMAYWNLSVDIRLGSKIADLTQATVLITAVDNVAPILTRLFRARPKHIVYPFTVI